MNSNYILCIILVLNNGWNSNFVSEKGAYASKGNQWVSYNNHQYIREKANFVLAEKYGGVSALMVDMDDFNNECCFGPNPLLNILNRLLRKKGKAPSGGNCQKPAAVTTPAPPETSTGYDDGGRFSSTT